MNLAPWGCHAAQDSDVVEPEIPVVKEEIEERNVQDAVPQGDPQVQSEIEPGIERQINKRELQIGLIGPWSYKKTLPTTYNRSPSTQIRNRSLSLHKPEQKQLFRSI